MMPLAVFSWIYTGARGTLSSKGPLMGGRWGHWQAGVTLSTDFSTVIRVTIRTLGFPQSAPRFSEGIPRSVLQY
jgi:hypothetical protein